MKISTDKTKVLFLSRNPRQCMLRVSSSPLQQMEKLKYLGVVFTNDGKRNKEIDTRIGKANAVLRELYRCVVTKWELSNTARFSIFKPVFVPILTNGHESWLMTKRILTEVQAAETGFSRRVHGLTLCDKVRKCEIRKALNVEPLPRINTSQVRWFGHTSRMSRERLWWGKSFRLHPGRAVQRSFKVQVEWLHLRPCLVLGWRIQQKYLKICCWPVFRVLLGMLPLWPSPKEKRAWKWTNDWTLLTVLYALKCCRNLNLCASNVGNLFHQILGEMWK